MLSHEAASHNTSIYEHPSGTNGFQSVVVPAIPTPVSQIGPQSHQHPVEQVANQSRMIVNNNTDSNVRNPQLSRPQSSIPRPTAIPRLTSLVSDQPPLVDTNGTHSNNSNNGRRPFEKQNRSISHTPSQDGTEEHNFVKELTPRSRGMLRSDSRLNRAISENPHRQDGDSDSSSVFSGSGQPRVITSKIASFQNMKHKPGGGNVQIFDEKVQVTAIGGKCNSFANMKHKPGGGDVKILNEKVDFSSVSSSKIGSLQNVKHVPTGGDKKIFDSKPEFDKVAKSKVGSMKNTKHQPAGGNVQIFNEQLPWLKYNKPNLSVEEKQRINKRSAGTNRSTDLTNSFTSSSTEH